MLVKIQCILYSNIPKFKKIYVQKDDILNKNFTKFQKNWFNIFITIKYK